MKEVDRTIIDMMVQKYGTVEPKCISDRIFLYAKYLCDKFNISDGTRYYIYQFCQDIRGEFFTVGHNPRTMAITIVEYFRRQSAKDYKERHKFSDINLKLMLKELNITWCSWKKENKRLLEYIKTQNIKYF